MPVAAKTRPQLGSLPKMAHLSKLLRAFARPTFTASDSVAEFITLIEQFLKRLRRLQSIALRVIHKL